MPTVSRILGFGFMFLVVACWQAIDTPPTSIPAPWAFPDVVVGQLWAAQCDAYEREGQKYSLIVAHVDLYGVIMEMDCKGNVVWPYGQEIGAAYLAEVLGMYRW